MEYRTDKQWLEIAVHHKALWKHDGNPKRPHALLTSGAHSDGFFHAKKLLFDDCRLGQELCADLVNHKVQPHLAETMTEHNFDHSKIVVVGPTFGTVTMAPFIAAAIGSGVGCAFTVPKGKGGAKLFTLEKRFLSDLQGKYIVPVEDVITSGDSISKTIAVVKEFGGNVLPFILAIFNRSGVRSINHEEDLTRQIISMFDIKMTTWNPKKGCPLCKGGSEALRPKEADKWSRLNAVY